MLCIDYEAYYFEHRKIIRRETKREKREERIYGWRKKPSRERLCLVVHWYRGNGLVHLCFCLFKICVATTQPLQRALSQPCGGNMHKKEERNRPVPCCSYSFHSRCRRLILPEEAGMSEIVLMRLGIESFLLITLAVPPTFNRDRLLLFKRFSDGVFCDGVCILAKISTTGGG